MKTKWRWVKGWTARGKRAPSLSVHKMPRPSYEVDSVSLSTDPKVTESFWDYLNGRIDRLILWPSRKGYCSALHPFFHIPPSTLIPCALLLPSAAEEAGLAPPGCLYPHASIRTSFTTPSRHRHTDILNSIPFSGTYLITTQILDYFP